MNKPEFREVDGHRIAYHRQGTGSPVLLVHGITTYSFIWDEIICHLSPSYDVIALDLLGCGDSSKPLDVSYSVKNHAEIVSEFIRLLRLPCVHYVGHDIGGGIGQVLAVRHPEQLQDLSMINTVAYDYWPVQPIIAMRTPIIRQFALATLDLGTFKLIIKRGVYHKDRITEKIMESFFAPMKTSEGRKGFLHFAKSLDNTHLMEISDQLRALKMPVLIIRGDADVYLSEAISERLHREIPGSQLIRFAHAGHFIHFDDSPGVAEKLHSFFQGS
jgi:pimeloyl-ACP methyl ester carboxylesterase